MSDDLETLVRWEHAGGTWSVVHVSADRATVALCRCDGGEQVDRFTSTDPALLAHVTRRSASEISWLPPADPAG
ncbi:hypothetical protein [Mumia zhuanghuii]|uniref:Uncharacterized protein n=1 Tax=Mumia zhuanghuii TaxID=2585211 RepID=A0A5C4MQX2_9ACTN|nr:hypothetical protein [Mumia zhuanghuii]TNC46134.1 hypothetical protein FHE65_13815 [Mumia zhuanghuii]TNC48841.1 hypothetical protein FHE65_06640 [Mumia zhuanghuii]